jgi:hypothetical protein
MKQSNNGFVQRYKNVNESVSIEGLRSTVQCGRKARTVKDRKLEEITCIRCNSRICRTCVRILEELLIVINRSVSAFEV